MTAPLLHYDSQGGNCLESSPKCAQKGGQRKLEGEKHDTEQERLVDMWMAEDVNHPFAINARVTNSNSFYNFLRPKSLMFTANEA